MVTLDRTVVPTTVLIRHADVPAGAGIDPALSAEGLARARELRHVLRDTGIGAIFVTQFRRTKETAKPLAEDLGITPTVIDDVEPLVTAIRALPPGSRALVVGHTNTVPDVISGLGGPAIPAIGATEFDNLFVQAQGRLIHLRYGA
jgi:broad specificity phosphatase PhoE